MGAFINNSVTDAGNLAIAKALSGGTIKFTKIVMGDGELPEGQEVQNLEAVISPKATIDIVKKTIITPSTAVVGGVFLNNETGEGFFWRELGLYAEDPDPDVGEILYSYGNAGGYAEWIPPSGSQTSIEKSIDILTAVGPAANIAIHINADAYATVAQYEYYLSLALEAAGLAEQAIEIANEAMRIASEANATSNSMKTQVDDNTGKIATMWDALFGALTTNPFLVTFGDLTGIKLTSGIWNKQNSRIEC